MNERPADDAASDSAALDILMLSHVIAPAGGIEAALVDLTQELIARGHRVRIYSCRAPQSANQYTRRLREAGAELRSAPAWLPVVAGASPAARARLLEATTWLLTPLLAPVAAVDAILRRRAFRRAWVGARGVVRRRLGHLMRLEALYYLPLELWLRSSRPDVVHLHGWGCGFDPPGGLEWSRRRGFPTVYTEHNSPPQPEEGATRPPSWLHLADAIIACSRAGATGLRSVCGAAGPITAIPYGVADPMGEGDPVARLTEEVAPTAAGTNGSVTYTCLARLSPQHKGQDILLRAWQKVLESSPDARLLFAGDGDGRDELTDLARRLGVTGSTTFLGTVPRTELGELMATSDVMVLPSRWEGLPVSIIESMAFGKPVVASEAGGNPELVAHGDTGLVVPVGDVDALVSALTTVGRDAELRLRMGQAARSRFESGGFRPAEVAAATERVYRSAITARRAKPALPRRGEP